MRAGIVVRVLAALGLAVSFMGSAYGQEVPHGPSAAVAQPEPGRIAYKQDSTVGVAGLLVRVGGGLLLMTMLAVATALLAKRYLPGIRGFSQDGKHRVQLLESRRITPKLTVFVIEFEGRRLLLAQSGDRLLELGTRAGTADHGSMPDE